jgi:putative nucleotidyltransferase with HDIG domain
MSSALPQTDLELLVPADAPFRAHCRRVAALAAEIAQRLSVSLDYRIVLEQAALLHHTIDTTLDGALPDDLTSVLALSRSDLGGHPDRRIRLISEILTLSNLLDEQMEYLSLESRPMSEVWAELQLLRGLFEFPVLEAARNALIIPFHCYGDRGWGLPVQATVAREVLAVLAGKKDIDIVDLAGVASRDPVLAGNLIQAANSALYARLNPARTVLDAISFLGTDDARKILMALSLRPLFASARLTNLWKHSIRMAQFAEGLARSTGFMDPEEALLLGLVHDIGRIALQNHHREGLATYGRLADRGCPAIYVERLLFGRDHAGIGSAVLHSWQFPDDLVEAVRYHHQPADSESMYAAALFAAEFWVETNEDLCPIRHLSVALSRVGWSREMLAAGQAFQGPLASLLVA